MRVKYPEIVKIQTKILGAWCMVWWPLLNKLGEHRRAIVVTQLPSMHAFYSKAMAQTRGDSNCAVVSLEFK